MDFFLVGGAREGDTKSIVMTVGPGKESLTQSWCVVSQESWAPWKKCTTGWQGTGTSLALFSKIGWAEGSVAKWGQLGGGEHVQMHSPLLFQASMGQLISKTWRRLILSDGTSCSFSVWECLFRGWQPARGSAVPTAATLLVGRLEPKLRGTVNSVMRLFLLFLRWE